MELISVNGVGEILLLFLDGVEVGLGVAVELPDVDSIFLASGEYHVVVQRVEHALVYGVSVSDEGLIVERNCRLSIVVPHLEEVVISARQHVATIERQVGAVDSPSVDGVKLSLILTFEAVEGVDTDSLVLGDDNQLRAVVGELERADDVANLDMVLENDRLSVVDHDAVSVLAHHSEERLGDNHCGSINNIGESFAARHLGLLLRVLGHFHVVEGLLQVRLLPVHSGDLSSRNWRRESHVNKLRWELKMHHLSWQVLSAGIMQGDTSVLAAGDEQLSIRGVSDCLDRLVVLGELIGDAGLLNVEYPHGS